MALTTGSFAATAGGAVLETGFAVGFLVVTGRDDLLFGCTVFPGGGGATLDFGATGCVPTFLPAVYPVGMALSAARRRAATTELEAAFVSALFFARGKEC